MYIIDGICYAGNAKPGLKINSAKSLQGKMMLVEFSTGEKRLFDASVLTGSAFAPLDDDNIFNHPQIFHGVISWKNGEIDVSPEMVYANSVCYNEYDV